jgi:catechol 2,3-dioxygenase-like lactoylglutathione lyase family enzyme
MASITGFHHAQVTVPKGRADEVRKFFGQVLGLTEIPVASTMTNYGLIWFRVGDRELHVGQEDGIDRTKTGAHLAYHVDDVKAWRVRMGGYGFEPIEHVRDPFGNRIEIIGPE